EVVPVPAETVQEVARDVLLCRLAHDVRTEAQTESRADDLAADLAGELLDEHARFGALRLELGALDQRLRPSRIAEAHRVVPRVHVRVDRLDRVLTDEAAGGRAVEEGGEVIQARRNAALVTGEGGALAHGGRADDLGERAGA